MTVLDTGVDARPDLFCMYQCQFVHIASILIENSPSWNVWLSDMQDVLVDVGLIFDPDSGGPGLGHRGTHRSRS